MRGSSSLKETKKGAAILLTVLLLGGIIVEIGIANVFLIFYSGQSIFGVKFSAEALAAAEAGVEDGKIKVVRDKNIDYTSSNSPYAVAVGTRSVEVSICRNSKTVVSACDTPATGKTEIIAVGTAFNRKRKLKAMLNVDSLTGKIEVESVEELAI